MADEKVDSDIPSELATTALQDAYRFLEKHDPKQAKRQYAAIMDATNDLQRSRGLLYEREAKYNGSLWQRLTQNKQRTLEPYQQVIRDKLSWRGKREHDLMRAASDLEKDLDYCRDLEVAAGNFVYYRVQNGTNVRRSHDGIPIMYESLGSAKYARCGEVPETAISVAEYNRAYGAFMPGQLQCIP